MAKQRTMLNPRSTTNVVLGGMDGNVHEKVVRSIDALKLEARELRRAADECQHISGIGVPRVLLVDNEARTLSTSHFDGESLFNYVWNRTSCVSRSVLDIEQSESLGRKIGRWLRAYHRSSLEKGVGNAAEWIELAASAGRKLTRVALGRPSLLTESEAAKIRSFLEHSIGTFDFGSSMDSVQLHGDFVPSNLLIDRHGELCVVDFADSRFGPPDFDYVRFEHDLWAASEVGTRRNSALLAMRDAFHAGHGATILPPHRKFLKCWNAVCFLASYLHSRKFLGFTGRWTARRIARVHTRWLRTEIVGTPV